MIKTITTSELASMGMFDTYRSGAVNLYRQENDVYRVETIVDLIVEAVLVHRLTVEVVAQRYGISVVALGDGPIDIYKTKESEECRVQNLTRGTFYSVLDN